jgi:hypothetical protein
MRTRSIPQWFVCIASSALLFAGIAQASESETQAPTLTPLWSLDGFEAPESVAFDARRDVLYVSNVAGEGGAKDHNGYISRVSPDGRRLDARWVDGLHAPKGLAVRGRRLFTADVTDLVEIELPSGRVIARHPAPDAAFLNDVLATASGEIYISDSDKSRIYRWRDGRMQVWLEHAELRSINGLLGERDRLVVSTMQGKLLAVDWRTREISTLADDLGDADGIAALGSGRYLVSEWPGRLFHVDADGRSMTLFDWRDRKRYINDFILLGRSGGKQRLIVPSWEPGTLAAYRVER